MTTPRRATPADAEGITRLRSELFLSQPLAPDWLAVCRDQLAERLQTHGDARAYVVDAPEEDSSPAPWLSSCDPRPQDRPAAGPIRFPRRPAAGAVRLPLVRHPEATHGRGYITSVGTHT